MNREVISQKQGIALMVLFIMNGTLLLPTGVEAEKDLWIAIIVAVLFALPMVIIYARLISQFLGKDLFDINEIVLGRVFGRGINILYTWFVFHMGALVVRDFGEFINTVAFIKTPMITVMIFSGILSIWILKSGIEVIGRFGEVIIIPLLIAIIVFIVFLTPNMELSNIRPILNNGISPVLRGAFSAFSFPFGETVVFMMIFSSLQSKKANYRVYVQGLLLGGIIVLFTELTTILVLGINSYSTVYFPGYTAARRLSIGNIFQRLEIIGGLVIVIGTFLKMSICMLGVSKGIVKIFKFKEYRFIVTPVVLLNVNLAYFISDNIMEFTTWSAKIWPYYAFPFQVILPLLIFIISEIRIGKTRALGGTKIG